VILATATSDHITLIAVAALVVAALSLVVSAATFAVGWYYQRKLTTRRLAVTGNFGFVVMSDNRPGPTCMCVGVFNEGLVGTTLTNVAFEMKGRSETLQPTEWYMQRPQPLPIRLEPGDTWDGYMTLHDLGARWPRGTTIRVRPSPVAAAAGRVLADAGGDHGSQRGVRCPGRAGRGVEQQRTRRQQDRRGSHAHSRTNFAGFGHLVRVTAWRDRNAAIRQRVEQNRVPRRLGWNVSPQEAQAWGGGGGWRRLASSAARTHSQHSPHTAAALATSRRQATHRIRPR
jgi:hypothetical protein